MKEIVIDNKRKLVIRNITVRYQLQDTENGNESPSIIALTKEMIDDTILPSTAILAEAGIEQGK